MSSFDWLRSQVQPVGPFSPSYNDVCRVRAILKRLRLPTELVLEILEHAQYWPTREFKSDPSHPIVATARNGRPSAATLCLDAGVFNNPIVNPIRASGERYKIKDIMFDIVSHDQGWTSEGTQGSFSTSSWLEVSILRNETNSSTRLPGPRLVNEWISSPQDFHRNMVGRGWFLAQRPAQALQGPQDGEGDFAWYLQGNRVVDRETYRVIWSENESEGNMGAGSGEGFLQEVKEGDRIIVWARAKVCAFDLILLCLQRA
ncbi:hypothetical protein BKA66DRAFT_406195 [Pyrenochaeta sp. MPI-SDFR-AT-0127]|nr:hypothetical protein BKA66DRAFT_406195 [Pyrenochaeta sp. MPI-SDFR-AT-0127]